MLVSPTPKVAGSKPLRLIPSLLGLSGGCLQLTYQDLGASGKLAAASTAVATSHADMTLCNCCRQPDSPHGLPSNPATTSCAWD